MRSIHLLLISTFMMSASMAVAETSCEFLSIKAGFYKSKSREIPIKFGQASMKIQLAFRSHPTEEELKARIQKFHHDKAELDFNELANSIEDGIESVLIPITLEEHGLYGKVFFRYIEDTWGSAPAHEWVQYEYTVGDNSVFCK